MKKILEKCKKTVLFYWFIYVVFFILSREILLACNMNYMQWIYIISFLIISMGFIVGIIQLMLKIRNKIVKIVSIVIFSLLIICSIPYAFFAVLFLYAPEEIVIKDDKKMVTYTRVFWEKDIDYYDYINFIVRGKNRRILESYGEHGSYTTIYYDEDGNVIKKYNENLEENNTNIQETKENEIIDVTDRLRQTTYNGIITDINENEIMFEKENKKYKLKIEQDYKYINARTEENIGFADIKKGYYIDTTVAYLEEKEKVIAIASNITGEELKKELLKHFALGENAKMGVSSPDIKNIEVINSEKAIVTMEFQDRFGEYLNNNEVFEQKIIVNSNTKITSKSRLAYSVETLKNAAHDIVTIVLDKNTLNDEYPVAISFSSSDS